MDRRPSCPLAYENVHLDGMDGREFEHLCARIFERAGMGRVEVRGGVRDGGVDLLVRGPSGEKTVVECKHWRGTVGRPVVQKLYAAMVSEGAVRGIVVTTGRYSADAVRCAKEFSGASIELYGHAQLADLADSARIRLVRDGHQPVGYFPAAPEEEVRGAVSGIVPDMQSHPSPPPELARISVGAVRLEPVYILKADVDRDFESSTYRIHSVHERGVELMLDSRGRPVDDWIIGAVGRAGPDAPEPEAQAPLERPPFECRMDEAKSAAAGILARMYEREVSWKGRNNVTYRKKCTISARDVRFTDARQARLPVVAASVSFLSTKYGCAVVTDGSRAVAFSGDLGKCSVCGSEISKKAALCNSCGGIHHGARFRGGHGHRCGACEKTVCRNCAFWERRMLLFKRMLCGQCASGAKGARKLC